MEAFETANGHPYTVEDHKIAIENGAIVQAGFLTIPIAFLLLVALVSDTRHYRKCVKAFKRGEITERPDRTSWLIRAFILTVCVIGFGSYFYGCVPHMLRPLP